MCVCGVCVVCVCVCVCVCVRVSGHVEGLHTEDIYMVIWSCLQSAKALVNNN